MPQMSSDMRACVEECLRCEAVGEMQDCVDACHRCAESCRRMAA